MRKSRYSDSQILAILKQNENGVSVPELCREHGMSTAMFYKWRSKRGRPSCNAISASGDGDGNQRAIRRECSVCVPLLGYQRGNVLLQAQVVP